MFSIVYGSGPLTPEFLQLRLDIVNSVSRGRLLMRSSLSFGPPRLVSSMAQMVACHFERSATSLIITVAEQPKMI